MKKSWLCRLGLHGLWYMDGALFASAERCGRCNKWRDPVEGAAVERAREAVMRDPETMLKAARNLYPPDA